MNAYTDIFAKLEEIEYQANLSDSLDVFGEESLRNGSLSSKSSFILRLNEDEYALSQWVSPKRTRSFPFARVYDTLCRKNRVTLIPFCKDEGADGDRDFIQWDTVSLMSLLNVFVVICYHNDAEKSMRPAQVHKNKITKQTFDYRYVHRKLIELQQYHSSALHWNLKQLEELPTVANLTLNAYREISKRLKVTMHNKRGIDNRIQTITKNIYKFKEQSRDLAQKAQHREILIEQPKEKVIGDKATVTLQNLLGGTYYWTADEYFVLRGRVFLVEKKHSSKKWFPSILDIKDAFIKIMLFSNIKELTINNKKMPCIAAVGLTSTKMRGVFHSKMTDKEIAEFFNVNKVNESDQNLVKKIVIEARQNNFGVFALNAKDVDSMQENILRELI